MITISLQLISYIDVRELISVDDVQEDKQLVLGPNGALVFCMEYLVQNLDWLHDQLNEGEDDYFIFDCPGSYVIPLDFMFNYAFLISIIILLRILFSKYHKNPSTSIQKQPKYYCEPNNSLELGLT